MSPSWRLPFLGDGLRLAAGLSKRGFASGGWPTGLMEEDRDYQDPVQALDFGPGRLAVASSDGAVRLYAATSQERAVAIRSKGLQQKLDTRHGSCVSPPTGGAWRSRLRTSLQWKSVRQAIYRWRRNLTSIVSPVTKDFTRSRGRSTARLCSREETRLKLQASKYQVFAWAKRGSGPRRVASSDSDQVISAIWMLRDPNSLVAADTGPAINVFADGNSKAKKQKPQVNFAYLSSGRQ